MKKRVLSLVLTVAMVLAVLPVASFAEGEQTLAGNLLKVTTTADFEAGEVENLVIDETIGNGAIVLEDDANEGTYISPIYTTDTWVKGVASWSAGMYDGGQVEVWARARIDGEWTEFLTWGPYSPFISRGTLENKDDDLAYVNTDVFTVRNGEADAVQMKVVLSRDSAEIESPEVRQIAMSFTGGEMEALYTEDEIEIPAYKFNPAPGYCQSGRSDIGGSMCSPTTISVLLNSRNPELNIIPEALANATEDNAASSYSFGNWSFCASIPGLYGYDCYMQYASKDILLQELAQGRTVGISVEYSKAEGGSYPYLENAYSNTGGHLISIIGYEYEDGIMDDEHLYFISSDSYASTSIRDTDVYRSYKWTQLDECWNNRVAYIIPSLTTEENANTTGIIRVDAILEQDENDTTLFTMVDEQGNALDMTNVTDGERTILAYTVEGFKSEPAQETDYAIAYEEAFQVEANNTFTYANLELNEDGQIVFNASAILADLGLEPNDPRTVTVYAMGSEGYIYAASAVLEVTPDKTIVVTPEGSSVVASEKDGKVLANLVVDNLEGDLTVGMLIPENGDVTTATVTIDGEEAEILDVYTDENDVSYAVVKLDPSKTEQTAVITWGEVSDTYVYDLLDVVIKDNTVTQESGNVVFADLTAGVITDALVRNEDGTIALKEGETEGIYTSPVYDTFDWEYAMGFLGAYTPTGTAADLQIRAFTERGEAWSKWLSMGSAGAGSTSISEQDDYTNMSTDVYMIRGSSSVANAQRFQLRVVLTSDGENQPAVFNAGITYKKATFDPSEAEHIGATAVEELPASAGIDAEAYSAYSYRSGMRDWRFENMELIMMNAQGADLLYEEVALANYDHATGWGNWAMTNYKPGAHGYFAYTQFGANSTLIQQMIADGYMVGVYVHGGYVPGTNSNKSSQTIVTGYTTAEDGTVMFSVICPRGDVSELNAGKVYGELSAAELDDAIKNFGSGNPRGLMYVVGDKAYDSSWARVDAKAVMTDADNTAFSVTVDGEALVLDSDFTDNYKKSTQGGIIAYTLASETDADGKLAAGKFHYDITSNGDGTFAVPEDLKAELDAQGSAQIYIVSNEFVTYTMTLEHTWDKGEVTEQPTYVQEGVKTYTCKECGATYTVSIPKLTMTPGGLEAEEIETPVEPEQPFVDVADQWFTEDVEYVYENGLMNGVTATEFAPNANLTRGMLVTILWRMDGQTAPLHDCQFADVADGSYYELAIAWAAENGIVTGFNTTEFKPDANVTREQFAAILFRYAQYKGMAAVTLEENLLGYADESQISAYAIPAMNWAVGQSLINGIGNELQPQGNATRAQAAAILHRYCENMQ